MALKRPGGSTATETPRERLKRVKNKTGGDWPSKAELEGRPAIFTLISYDPDHTGPYGSEPRAEVDLVLLDTSEPVRALRLHGNAGRNAGEGLETPGTSALGKIVKGVSDQGREFWGIEWSEDEAEIAKAEAYLK